MKVKNCIVFGLVLLMSIAIPNLASAENIGFSNSTSENSITPSGLPGSKVLGNTNNLIITTTENNVNNTPYGEVHFRTDLNWYIGAGWGGPGYAGIYTQDIETVGNAKADEYKPLPSWFEVKETRYFDGATEHITGVLKCKSNGRTAPNDKVALFNTNNSSTGGTVSIIVNSLTCRVN